MPGILGYLLSLLKPLTVHHPAIGCPPRQNSWPAWSLFNLAFAASQPSMPLYRLHNLKLYDFYDVTNIFMGRALRGRASLGSPGGSSWISQKARRALRKGWMGGDPATETLHQENIPEWASNSKTHNQTSGYIFQFLTTSTLKPVAVEYIPCHKNWDIYMDGNFYPFHLAFLIFEQMCNIYIWWWSPRFLNFIPW